MERVEHPFPPVYDQNSRTLILGTMASPMSRKNGFYYAHPQNRFFPVLAAVYGEPVPGTVDARRDFLLRHSLALWDVIQSCDIVGASDASIRNAVPNDVAALVHRTKISRIFTSGQTAGRLYRALLQDAVGLPCHPLPSPSPANCRIAFAALVDAYRVLQQG